MPIIQIKLATPRETPDLKLRAARIVSDASTTILGKDPAVTAVVVELVSPADWFCGGRSLAETGHSSFFVDIKIVETTNDKGEKASFIREVFTRLGELLGNLHPESYVYIHEVRADAYGFGGLTQERRYIAKELGIRS